MTCQIPGCWTRIYKKEGSNSFPKRKPPHQLYQAADLWSGTRGQLLDKHLEDLHAYGIDSVSVDSHSDLVCSAQHCIVDGRSPHSMSRWHICRQKKSCVGRWHNFSSDILQKMQNMIINGHTTTVGKCSPHDHPVLNVFKLNSSAARAMFGHGCL